MADINSSFDEILTELGDSYDTDISASGRKIVRSTANKIWLMLRAFSRGLYGLYQAVAALRYRFDPVYCTDEELESTMRITGTTRKAGKTSLLTVTIWNNNVSDDKTLPMGSYSYLSANGITFSLVLQEDLVITGNSFVKKDFFSSIGGEPYIGAFDVSDNTSILVVNDDEVVLDTDISFDCEENSSQLGYPEETLFEVRQRILSDNQRQEILHLLEERLQDIPNIHECTVLANNTLLPVDSPYLQDDDLSYVPILPQSVLIILTGSPTADFALQFVSLCPFVTTIPVGVADYGTVYYETDVYVGGRFPIYYLLHRIETFDLVIEYGYSSRQVVPSAVEASFLELVQSFKANTRFRELISTEDFSDALVAYQNPAVRILSINLTYGGSTVRYIRFDKTQIARLDNVTFQQVVLWT